MKKIIFIAVVIILAGSIWFYEKNKKPAGDPDEKLTLAEAAEMGETVAYKLMIQIETPKGNPEDLKGRYEKGDIVLILPASHEFSTAEKEGFLIIKVDLTEKQTQLLTRSLNEIKKEKDEAGMPLRETLKRRKFYVDLAKIGIAGNDQKGHEITDKSFKWKEVIGEKKK